MNIQHPRLKALIFVLLCAAPLLGAALVWHRGETVIPLAAYGVVSVVAFFLYWVNMHIAIIGAGISGLLTALELVEQGCTVS